LTAKLSIQGGLISVPLSEFKKGLKELGMEAVNANSPHAKDRFKRFFRTIQDRLAQEICLREIQTIEEGNRFLETSLPLYHEMSLACPGSEDKLHRLLPNGLDLDATYNAIFVHSESGYICPEEFEEFYSTQISLKKAA
jgi:hypothetical protein